MNGGMIIIHQECELPTGTIFSGSPSQLINVPHMVWGVMKALAVALIPVFFGNFEYAQGPWVYAYAAVAAYFLYGILERVLITKTTKYHIDFSKITWERGILNKQISSLDLFRIQDVSTLLPWWLRLFGLGTVVIRTTDSNNPWLILFGIPSPDNMREVLSTTAKQTREALGIKEVNMAHV